MAEQDGGSLVYQVDIETAKMLTGSRQASAVLEEMNRKANQSSKAVDGLSSSANSAGRSMSGLKAVLSGVASAISVAIVLDYAKAFLVVADNINQLQSRISRLSADSASAAKTFESLSSIASETGASLQDTTKLWETMTSSLKEAGASNDQILALTDTLQKIGRVGGSSSEEMANALRQFGQSIASGVVRAEEFNSILEQMPELARQIAAGLGMSMGELRQAMLDGKLTAQDALNSIMKQSAKVNIEFEKLPRTLDQANNSLTISFQSLISKMNETSGASNTIISVIDSLSAAMDRLSGKTISAKQQIADLRSEAEMYARRARTWEFLGFGDYAKENEEKSSKLTAEAWEKASQAGYEAAKKRIKNSDPIQIPTHASSKSAGKGKTQQQKDAEYYARAQESVAEKLEQLRQKSELAGSSTQELSRAQAVLTAEQSLGKSATEEQIRLAGEYAGKIWDTTNALRARQQAEQGATFANQEIASAKTTVNPATKQAEDPVAMVELQEQRKLEALARYQEIDKENSQLYEDAKTAILQQAAYQRQEILDQEQRTYQQNISSLLGESSSFAGSIADAIGQAAGKSSAAYQALFAISKGFAIAQASLNLQTAISNAMAIPWPANIPAISQALSAGTQIVSAISGISYGGARYNGGPVSAGAMYQVGERGKPEIYQASTGKQYMIPGDNGRVISNKQMTGGSSAAPTIIIENYSSGAGVMDTQASKGINGDDVIRIVLADIQQGGQVSRGISQYHQAPRRATE